MEPDDAVEVSVDAVAVSTAAAGAATPEAAQVSGTGAAVPSGRIETDSMQYVTRVASHSGQAVFGTRRSAAFAGLSDGSAASARAAATASTDLRMGSPPGITGGIFLPQPPSDKGEAPVLMTFPSFRGGNPLTEPLSAGTVCGG